MEESSSTHSNTKRKLPKIKKTWIVLVILLLLALLPSYYFYNQYQKTQEALGQNAEAETAKLVATVGKLIELPVNETPTIATVSDKSKLSGQQFFANAQNGDKVLIYSQAKKAILYRPSTNKIIEVAPINLAPSPSVSPTEINQSLTPTIEVSPTLTPTSFPSPSPTSIPIQ